MKKAKGGIGEEDRESLAAEGGHRGGNCGADAGGASGKAEPEILTPPPRAAAGEQSISVQAAPGPDPAPPAEVPHLLSPENLPPGTTDDPTEPPQGAGVSYLATCGTRYRLRDQWPRRATSVDSATA